MPLDKQKNNQMTYNIENQKLSDTIAPKLGLSQVLWKGR